MKSFRFVFYSMFFCFSCVEGQTFQAQIDSSILPTATGGHYQSEFNLDAPLDIAKWNGEQKGMNVVFGSSDQKYFRTEVPDINKNNLVWEATGWKGERLNAQIVVWSVDTLNQVHFTVNDLLNEKGKILSKNNIRLNLVYFVLSNYPYNAKGFDCGPTPYKNGYLMPDRFVLLNASDQFDLPAKTVRSVWLSCNVPSNAEPGNYKGIIEVQSGKEHTTLKIQIRVQNQLLPNPHDWKYRLDLWQNPWVIAEYYHVKPWGEEHKALLKKHLQIYAEAGGT
ncbi:MAG TPA: glycoside hydrolase domain-containing protein, partial [Puia sp.]|nr:glycoside hydrolase domain-containing protein [Puia sp.]